MKPVSFSINKIKKDPQIITLNNRIRFIQTRRRKMRGRGDILITLPQKNPTQYNNRSKSSMMKRQVTQIEQHISQQKQTNQKQKLSLLKNLKSQERRKDSQKFKILIKQHKDSVYKMKRVKRNEIYREQLCSRNKMFEFQCNQFKKAKQNFTSRICEAQNWVLKSVKIKKQLCRAESQSINNFQNSLSYKSELMRRIKQMLKENQNNI